MVFQESIGFIRPRRAKNEYDQNGDEEDQERRPKVEERGFPGSVDAQTDDEKPGSLLRQSCLASPVLGCSFPMRAFVPCLVHVVASCLDLPKT